MRIVRRKPQCQLRDDASDGAPLPQLLRRIYENRNVRSRVELDYALARLHPPAQLKGIADASALLADAITTDRRILIIGDYDADGATATAVALLGLRALGARHVDYLVPNRFEYGYGLSAGIAEVALQRHPQLDLVITVDNGISSIDGVATLRAAGVAVIVTDHHLPGDELPQANAIVNPNQSGCAFPSKALAGVGVLFYLLLATRAHLRDNGQIKDAPNLAELLDLVALGTVADMVPLDHNNRILVAQGIARIRAGRCRAGIAALLRVAGRARARIVASDFGFVIAPRINAAGRLDDISTGIECLIADDRARAEEYAQQLDAINRERRTIEQSMQAQALEIVARIERENVDGNANHRGWCLFDPDWHQGVVGRVASRIAERSQQPAIAFAPSRDGCLSGSARSVAGLHIRDLLAAIATEHPRMIEKFGGHAMAAGLTIDATQLAAFTDAFSARVGAHFAAHPPNAQIRTDGELAADELTLEMAELLRDAAPWGQQFEAPLFDGAFRVTAQRVVGERHLKMTLALPNDDDSDGDGASFDAIAFGCVEPGADAAPLDIVRAVYELDANEYRGARSLQLRVRHFESCDEVTE